MQIQSEHARIKRKSGTYAVVDTGIEAASRKLRLTFPHPFGAPELAGVTVEAECFAVRPGSSHPLWCDFEHPAGGMRSVFAMQSWASEAPATKAPFKRPTKGTP